MTSILAKWPKQPGETLDFDVSFADFLHERADSIASAGNINVVVPSGITLDSFDLIDGTTSGGASVAKGVVKLWLSGGSDNTKYLITVEATTVGGREKHAEVQIAVKDVK